MWYFQAIYSSILVVILQKLDLRVGLNFKKWNIINNLISPNHAIGWQWVRNDFIMEHYHIYHGKLSVYCDKPHWIYYWYVIKFTRSDRRDSMHLTQLIIVFVSIIGENNPLACLEQGFSVPSTELATLVIDFLIILYDDHYLGNFLPLRKHTFKTFWLVF